MIDPREHLKDRECLLIFRNGDRMIRIFGRIEDAEFEIDISSEDCVVAYAALGLEVFRGDIHGFQEAVRSSAPLDSPSHQQLPAPNDG